MNENCKSRFTIICAYVIIMNIFICFQKFQLDNILKKFGKFKDSKFMKLGIGKKRSLKCLQLVYIQQV